jgi:hypothetical protein
MEMPNAILTRNLKAILARSDEHDAYFSSKRFAEASHDELISLEEQRIKAAQEITRLYAEAYTEYHRATASA